MHQIALLGQMETRCRLAVQPGQNHSAQIQAY